MAKISMELLHKEQKSWGEMDESLKKADKRDFYQDDIQN